jgi:hypothetical protein
VPSLSGRRRWVVGVVTVVVVAAVGVTAWATTSGSGATYRTALVRRGAVDQSLTTTGVLSPVRSADADFQVAGTVTRVRATIGHQVAAGQVLAHLDRSSLRAALTAAQASLTNARSRRSEDESGELSAATTAVSSTSTSTSAGFELREPTRSARHSSAVTRLPWSPHSAPPTAILLPPRPRSARRLPHVLCRPRADRQRARRRQAASRAPRLQPGCCTIRAPSTSTRPPSTGLNRPSAPISASR